MKKSLITIAIVLLAVAAQAQIKMHSSGRISFQSLVDSPGYGVTIDPGPSWETNFAGAVHFLQGAAFRKNVIPYGWMNFALANSNTALAWVVSQDWTNPKFYVRGDGIAYATNHLTFSNNSSGHAKGSQVIDGREALTIISGIDGYYYEPDEQEIPDLEGNENVDPEAIEAMLSDFGKRTAALSGSNLEEVFPEAVRTDPQNRLCIDYQSVVTMLVEAVKQQQREIEELKAALQKNNKNK